MVLDSFFVLFLLQLIFYTTRHLCIDIDVCFNLSIVFYLLLIGFSVFFYCILQKSAFVCEYSMDFKICIVILYYEIAYLFSFFDKQGLTLEM